MQNDCASKLLFAAVKCVFMVVMFTYVTDPCPQNWLLEKTENVMEMLM